MPGILYSLHMLTKYQTAVVNGVGQAWENLSPPDAGVTLTQISGMEAKGWSEEDAIAYTKCMEEINPELDEDTAIAEMTKISKKYKTGK